MSPFAPVQALAFDETLTYSQRMRELALTARRTAGKSELAAVLSQFEAAGGDGPRIALHMAMAAHDVAYVERALTGPDMTLRRAALRAARTLPISDTAIVAALTDAPTELRRAIYRTLRHTGRTGAADEILPEVREQWGDREAAALLPACSAAVVARLLPELLHCVSAWRAIGRRHPRALLDAIDGGPQAAVDYQWWRRYRRGIAETAPLEPERVLNALDRHRKFQWCGELPTVALRALLRCDAIRTARLAAINPRYYSDDGPALLLTHRPALPAATLAEFITLWHLPQALPKVPPSLREQVFDAVAARDSRRAGDITTMPALGWLPPHRAAAEARRALEWHGSVWHSSRRRLDDPAIPLTLTSYLPFAEAVGALSEAAYGGEARHRARARVLLIECASRTDDPAVLRNVLTEIARRTRQDQDPLRAEVLEALSLLRIRLLEDGLVPAFSVLTEAVVQAHDTSDRSMFALRRLAARVVQHADPNAVPLLMDWAFDCFAKLIARFDTAALDRNPDGPERNTRRRRRRAQARPTPWSRFRLDRVLPRGTETRLLAALEPQLRARRERQDASLARALIQSLGARGAELTELQADLRAHEERNHEFRRSLWDRAWFAELARCDERLFELLIEDPQASLSRDSLWRSVTRERSDLLLAALAALRGIEPGWVPMVTGTQAVRWTVSQRDAVRNAVTDAANDAAQPVNTRLQAVRSLGRIPGSLPSLRELASHEDIVIAEAALDAMARIGEAEVMATLLDHAGGSTSAAAVAAMSRCARSVPPSRLGPLLMAAAEPGHKITVRKQSVRLLDRHRAASVDFLLHQWNQPDLHRDVRVALAAALQRRPEDPRTLDALLEAAVPGAPELLIRTLCQTGPSHYAPADRPRYAALSRKLLTVSTDPGVRFRTTCSFTIWARWYDGRFTDLIAAVGDPADPQGDDSLTIMLALLDSGVIGDEILPVLDRLLTVPRDDRARSRVRAIVDRVTRLIADQQRPGNPQTEAADQQPPGSPQPADQEPPGSPQPADQEPPGSPQPQVADQRPGSPQPQAADAARRRLAEGVRQRLAAHPLYLPYSAAVTLALLPAPTDTASARELAAGLVALAGVLADRPIHIGDLARSGLPSHFTQGRRQIEAGLILPSATALADDHLLSAQLIAMHLVERWGPTTDWSPPWRRVLDRLRGSGHLEVEQRAWDVNPGV
ncbi:hypothetical protein [Nocardia sp. NPDC020380]|uniref:hypothetical protein n=1 Tax=Nocardia sp. NPDC020380 TaxID=3364309 RepID=UPI0037AED994